MAQRTPLALQALIDTNLADNTTRDISEQDVRDLMTDFVDSLYFKTVDGFLPLSGGGPMSGDIDMGGWRVTNTLSATDPLDAVNLSQMTNTVSALKLDDLATPDDNTDLNASTSRHGLLPKLSGTVQTVLKGDGTFGEAFNGNEVIIASATTCDIGSVTSGKVSISGTTTITSFGTAPAGTLRMGRFTGTLVLTHNVAFISIPGSASVTTASGDRFIAYSLGTGTWVVSHYSRASGQPLGVVMDLTSAQTVGAGVKKTFQANGTSAGFRLGGVNASPSSQIAGDIWYRTDLGKIAYRGSSVARLLVEETLAQTLTNKIINGDSNTITDITNAAIKSTAAIALSKLANISQNEILGRSASGSGAPSALTPTTIRSILGLSYTEKHAVSHTIDATECYGGIHYITGDSTIITLPPAVAGMNLTISTVGNIAGSVKPDANDLLVLDGVALDDGDRALNTSTAGDLITLSYYDSSGWYAASNGWSDAGP